MKAAVFVLALVNLVFFAYAQGYFGRSDNPDTVRLHKQIRPEDIRVVGRGEPPAEKGEKKATEGDGKAAAESDGKEAAAKQEAKEDTKLAAAESCLTWTGFGTKDADRLASLLGEKFDDFKLTRKTVTASPDAWWVHIPPYPNKADADKKAGELKKLGIGDFFIVQDAGPNRWAISLGVFSTENGAKERLNGLKDKGVKSAKIAPRSSKESTQTLEARGPAARQKPLQEAAVALSTDFVAKTCQ